MEISAIGSRGRKAARRLVHPPGSREFKTSSYMQRQGTKVPAWALLPAFWAVLAGLSLAGVEARYSAPALAALLALHLLLAVTLCLALVVGRHLGTVAGFLAAAGAAGILVWHARELTYRPSGLGGAAGAALVLALPIHLWMRAGGPRPALRYALPALAGSVLLVAAGVVLAFESSPVLRWHLLRHNKLLGTPAYYLLADSVAELEERLFESHRGGKEPPPDDIAEDEDHIDHELADADLPMDRSPDRPHHLVFVLLDTLRADALEMGGGPRDAMPRLNAFLDGAYRFTDVIANASWTRPSMASMLTGLLPEEHGARDVDDPLEETATTLAEVLGGRGYETAAFVSNIGAVGESAGFAQGFDFFYELSNSPYARATQIRRTVERWLDRRGDDGDDGERPLFLYLHFLDPHEPYLAGRVPAAKSRAELAAAYREELLYLDGELGHLFELLKARLPGPRAVLVTSDHGEEFGEHEEFGHGYSLYREVIHVPLAFSTGQGGGDVHEPLEGRDVFDLVSTWSASGGHFDVPAWAAERSRSRRYASIYYSSEGRLLLRPYLRQVCMRSVESEGYKLVWSAYGSTFELYEPAADPHEQHNLAAARPDLVRRLAGLFESSVTEWRFPAGYKRSPEELEQLRTLGYVND